VTPDETLDGLRRHASAEGIVGPLGRPTLVDRLPVLRERAARGEAWESTTDEDVALLLIEVDRLRNQLAFTGETAHLLDPPHGPFRFEECPLEMCRTIRALSGHAMTEPLGTPEPQGPTTLRSDWTVELIIEHLIIDAWQDETPTAELNQVPDLMARIEREKAEARAATPPDIDALPDAWTLALWFHEAYEQAAPIYGYETRPESQVDFDDLPQPNRLTMVATAQAVLDRLVPPDATRREPRGE
jgi:hypothetical protein